MDPPLPSEAPQGDEREETTFSAGEAGSADAAPDRSARSEVVVGEIPAAEDPTTMLWTARCSDPEHDLLGHFGSEGEAQKARVDHLESAHGGAT